MFTTTVKQVAAAAALVCVTWSANADPISFIPSNTAVSIKFVDREIQITGLGEQLFGILDITQIKARTGPRLSGMAMA